MSMDCQTLSCNSYPISFADGNIVLIAGHTVFKVHRGQLERHSDVFRSLFSVPQPIDQHLVDGCPSVELYDDPADLHHLLVALYDGVYFLEHNATDFAIISSVLRLSIKYFIEHLRRCCIDYLASDCPTSLVEWDRRSDDGTDDTCHYSPCRMYTHPILILDLALELNLHDLLPSAFYNLARYSPSSILAGTLAPPPIFSTSADGELKGQIVRLSEKHLLQILVGREYAQRYIYTFLEDVLRGGPSTYCLNSGKPSAVHCSQSFYFIHLNVLRIVRGIAIGREADPLHTLLQAAEMLERTDFTDGVRTCGLTLCTACKADFRDAVFKARLEVWGLIPEWFGVREVKSTTDVD